MDLYRETAFFCIGRAVLFAMLANALVMLSFAFDPSAACRVGGTGALIVAAILLWFAQTAPGREPKRTETFLLLPKDARPRDEATRRVFANVMADTYVYFAARSFALSVALIATGLALGWLGFSATHDP